MEDKLLPCPFCGEDGMYCDKEGYYSDKKEFATCRDQNCIPFGIALPVKTWNKRADPSTKKKE